MRKHILIAAAALVFASAPALASHCPLDVKAANEALASNTSLDAVEKDKIQKLVDKGAKQHADGDHSGSVETLHQARHMLGIDH